MGGFTFAEAAGELRSEPLTVLRGSMRILGQSIALLTTRLRFEILPDGVALDRREDPWKHSTQGSPSSVWPQVVEPS